MVVALSAAVATIEVDVPSVAAEVVQVEAAGASGFAVAARSTSVAGGATLANPARRS